MSDDGESSGVCGSWIATQADAAHSSGPPKKKEYVAYKLIVDPSLVKGAFKTYRFDGNLPDDPSYPQVVVRDPRNPRRKKIANMSLPVPYFKVDKNYIGQPPPVEVTITNVNDNIGKNFLKDIITKQGDEGFHDLTVFYHPVTNKHLGLAHVVFKRPCYAQSCVDRLNNISFMGQKLSVFIDSVGDKCKQLFEELTSEPKKTEEKLCLEIKSASNNNHTDGLDQSPRLIKLTDSAKKPAILHESSANVNLISSEFMSTTNLTNGVYTERNQELYAAYRLDSKGLSGYTTLYPKPPVSSQNLTWGTQSDSFPISNPSSQVLSRQHEVKGDEDDSKLSTDETGSPKMDLDTRIKMLFCGKRSNDLGIRFSLEDVCSSDSEENLLPRKRPRLGIGSAEIWGSDSGDGEDTVESAFAKKFKRNTFVPVKEDSSAKNRANSSPPPSPFLALSSIAERSDSLPLETLESLKEKLENELEKISDESNGISPGKRKARRGDDMSLSSLSPEDPSYISLPPNPPPEHHFPPLPKDDPQVPPSYMHQYFAGYASVQFQPYMVPWNVSQEYQQQPYYPPNYEMYPQTLEDNNQSQEYSEEEEEGEDVTLNPMAISELVIERIYEELKNILRKDCRKRVIENEAYKKFETWCEKREQYHKTMQMQKIEQENKSFSVPEPPLSTFHGFDFKGPDSVFGGISSMGLGIRCSIPKLPSFRIRKPREPSPEYIEDDSRKSSDSEIGGSSSASEDEDDRRAPRRTLRRLSLSSDASSSTSSESSFEDDETDVESLSDDSVKQPRVTLHEARIKSDTLLGTESISEDSYSDQEYKSTIKEDAESVKKTTFDDDKRKSPIDVPFNETPSLDSLVSIKQEIDDLSVHEQPEDFLYPQKAFHLDDHNYCVSFDYKEEDRDKDVAIVPVKEEAYQRNLRENYQKAPSKNSFTLRTVKQQEEVAFDFFQLGLDTEELYFVKKAFEDSLLKDSGGYWINSAHWLDNASTSFPPKRSHVSDSERVHTTGSARSEGFYKLNGLEKARNRRQWGNFSESEQNGNYTVSLAEKSAAKTQLTISREARSNQRRLLTALGNEVDSDLLKFNQLKFRKKSLRFGRSTIHDWGLFASEPIAADEMVIEYVGQMIRPVIADLRERQYEAVGIGSSYLFRIDLENIIDATRCGNLSRFINHSCNPNCYAKIITIEGIKKIVIYSKQPIGVNEEITYDYKFPIEDDKIACLCGAFQCRGYLN